MNRLGPLLAPLILTILYSLALLSSLSSFFFSFHSRISLPSAFPSLFIFTAYPFSFPFPYPSPWAFFSSWVFWLSSLLPISPSFSLDPLRLILSSFYCLHTSFSNFLSPLNPLPLLSPPFPQLSFSSLFTMPSHIKALLLVQMIHHVIRCGPVFQKKKLLVPARCCAASLVRMV